MSTPSTAAVSTFQNGTPLLLTTRQAASVCGTSIRTWRSWDSAGKIPEPFGSGDRTSGGAKNFAPGSTLAVHGAMPGKSSAGNHIESFIDRVKKAGNRAGGSGLQSTDVEQHCHPLAGCSGTGRHDMRIYNNGQSI